MDVTTKCDLWKTRAWTLQGSCIARKTQMSSFCSNLEYGFCVIAVIRYPIRPCMMFLNEKSFSLSHYLSFPVISFLRFLHFPTFFVKGSIYYFLCYRSKGIYCTWWLLLNYHIEGNLDKMLGYFIWKQNLNTVCWHQCNVWQKRKGNPSSGSQKWWGVWLGHKASFLWWERLTG